MNIFPIGVDCDCEKKDKGTIISYKLFGNRFHSDQTLYEYLIEFLLIFVSAKDAELEDGKMEFHDVNSETEYKYWVEPRMGLRRFIFYDKAHKKVCKG